MHYGGSERPISLFPALVWKNSPKVAELMTGRLSNGLKQTVTGLQMRVLPLLLVFALYAERRTWLNSFGWRNLPRISEIKPREPN